MRRSHPCEHTSKGGLQFRLRMNPETVINASAIDFVQGVSSHARVAPATPDPPQPCLGFTNRGLHSVPTPRPSSHLPTPACLPYTRSYMSHVGATPTPTRAMRSTLSFFYYIFFLQFLGPCTSKSAPLHSMVPLHPQNGTLAST